MKKIVLLYFLPALLSLLTLVYSIDAINRDFFTVESKAVDTESVRYIANFKDNAYYEGRFLYSDTKKCNIYLLGSSELSEATEAHAFNFITDHFDTKVIGIGHAGNQCFSIYSQLLANESNLKDAQIAIILSPGWFQSDAAAGTTSPLFLEFNTPKFLNQLIQHAPKDKFRQYETERIADFYTEIVNPDLSLKLLYFEQQSSKSFLHKAIYAPLIAVDKSLSDYKSRINRDWRERICIGCKRDQGDLVTINWDSLYAVSKQQQFDISNNNDWAIANDYYNEYVNGDHGDLTAVPESENQELKDLRMLMALLKAKGVKASFIILPMNPFYYSNIKDLDPTMNSVAVEVKKCGYPLLNFWNSDSTTFEKGILKDVMHLSSYGWYKVDRFIVDTYKLKR